MRVLVTGGAGFIGSHIVDGLLAAGHTVAVLDNFSSGVRDNIPAGVAVYTADIRDSEALREIFDEFQPQWVSHQAAQISVSVSVNDPKADAEANVLGLLGVLAEARRVGVERFVFASSGGAIYGNVDRPASESHPGAPISPYGITKWVGERYLEFYSQLHQMQCIALRYANVYGPRQNPHGEAGVVAVFSTRMLAGEAVRINGDGRYLRDYVYVGDVARANLAAFAVSLPTRFGIFNVGTALGTDVNELERLIRTAATRVRSAQGESQPLPQPTFGPDRPGDIRTSLIDPTYSRQALGWEPRVSMAEGVEQTVNWFGTRQPVAGAKS